MAKFLKKFENHTQYDNYINGSGAILPNVSLCVSENDVHYNPSSPTPSLSIVSINLGTPPFYSDGSNIEITFSRPITFSELESLVFQFKLDEESECETINARLYSDNEYIWSSSKSNLMFLYNVIFSEDEVTTVSFNGSDATFIISDVTIQQ